jgi:hypothetical protein
MERELTRLTRQLPDGFEVRELAGSVSAFHVVDGGEVSFAEAVAVVAAHLWRDVGVAELVAVVGVGRAVVLEVAASAFDAVMEAALLELAELGGRCVPAAWTLGIAGRRGRRTIASLRESGA